VASAAHGGTSTFTYDARHRTLVSSLHDSLTDCNIQEDFASVFGFSLTQIRDWEQGRSRPLRSDRAYLMLIAFNHEQVLGMLGEVRKRDAREVA